MAYNQLLVTTITTQQPFYSSEPFKLKQIESIGQSEEVFWLHAIHNDLQCLLVYGPFGAFQKAKSVNYEFKSNTKLIIQTNTKAPNGLYLYNYFKGSFHWVPVNQTE
jgi:hypothetical protein